MTPARGKGDSDLPSRPSWLLQYLAKCQSRLLQTKTVGSWQVRIG
jgi:hypothetical protein